MPMGVRPPSPQRRRADDIGEQNVSRSRTARWTSATASSRNTRFRPPVAFGRAGDRLSGGRRRGRAVGCHVARWGAGTSGARSSPPAEPERWPTGASRAQSAAGRCRPWRHSPRTGRGRRARAATIGCPTSIRARLSWISIHRVTSDHSRTRPPSGRYSKNARLSPSPNTWASIRKRASLGTAASPCFRELYAVASLNQISAKRRTKRTRLSTPWSQSPPLLCGLDWLPVKTLPTASRTSPSRPGARI